MTTADTLAQEVIELLAVRGIAATFEYPGNVAITISDTEHVWTGFHGWEYGTLTELRDGTLEPNETEAAEPDGLTEDTTDARTIADAWAAWVTAYRSRSHDETPTD